MRHLRYAKAGFTSVELLVSVVIFGMIVVMLYPYFDNSVDQYLTLNEDAVVFSTLASESQRIAKIVRGATDILSADHEDITLYAYFSPNDTYVSKIRYYTNVAGDKLLADVTQMTANPPQGTPIVASLTTYTVIDDFVSVSGTNTFEYLDSAGSPLTLPIADLHVIKGVRISLAVPTETTVSSANTTLSIDVSLRNRKTNL